MSAPTTITVSSQAQLNAAIEEVDRAGSGAFNIVFSGNITEGQMQASRQASMRSTSAPVSPPPSTGAATRSMAPAKTADWPSSAAT